MVFNVQVTVYEGRLHVDVDCAGRCQFMVCPSMPPEEDDVCGFRDSGWCALKAAKVAAAKQVVARLKKWIKETDNEED